MSVSVYDHGEVPEPNELAALKARVNELEEKNRRLENIIVITLPTIQHTYASVKKALIELGYLNTEGETK